MTDLLSQLERATEGSRSLDWEVCRYVNGCGDCDPSTCPNLCLDYTTNLQDAVSLVPEGWAWSVSRITNDQHALMPYGAGYSADLRRDVGTKPVWIKNAISPCLALCIAIIKAHESKAEAA